MAEYDIKKLADDIKTQKSSPTEGMSIPAFGTGLLNDEEYPDESPLWQDQTSGPMPKNHGFPLDPMALLDSQLDAIEAEEAEAEKLWKESRSEAKLDVIAEERRDDEVPMTYAELVSPLSTEQIRKKRESKSEGEKAKGIEYDVVVDVFVLGGHDAQKYTKDGDPIDPYDDSDDKAAYEALLTSAVNGEVVLGKCIVEGIQNTSKFKIFVEVLRPRT